MFKKILVIQIIIIFTSQSHADSCLEWFLKSGLAEKKEDCELKCLITPVDMGSFSCNSQCENLCSKDLSEHILTYAPRLTEGDKVVISKMPYEAYKVFLAKEKVDRLVVNIFKKPSRKDESDAFRHFVWSTLIAQEIGIKKARIFLTAHEQDSTQSKSEKDMDVLNNNAGLTYFTNSSKKNNKLELIDIEEEALERLRQKKLKVLKPKFKKIPGGYYSK